MPVTTGFSEPGYRYQLILRGECGPLTAGLFGDAAIESGGGCTSVIFSARDDSELHGLLDRSQDVALHLISLNQIGGSSPGDVTAPCPAQTLPRTRLLPDLATDGVRSSPSWRVHEPCTLTEAVAPRPHTGLTGSGRHRYSRGGFAGGHSPFHVIRHCPVRLDMSCARALRVTVW